MDYKKNAVQNAGVIEKRRDKNDRAMKWLNERNDIQRDQGRRDETECHGGAVGGTGI